MGGTRATSSSATSHCASGGLRSTGMRADVSVVELRMPTPAAEASGVKSPGPAGAETPTHGDLFLRPPALVGGQARATAGDRGLALQASVKRVAFEHITREKLLGKVTHRQAVDGSSDLWRCLHMYYTCGLTTRQIARRSQATRRLPSWVAVASCVRLPDHGGADRRLRTGGVWRGVAGVLAQRGHGGGPGSGRQDDQPGCRSAGAAVYGNEGGQGFRLQAGPRAAARTAHDAAYPTISCMRLPSNKATLAFPCRRTS